MYRSVLPIALLCVLLSFASASESLEIAEVERHPHKKCYNKYCWKNRFSPYAKKIQAEKCGGTTWKHVQWCDRSKGTWTCKCSTAPSPKPSKRPPRPSTRPPKPTPPPKKILACGQFIINKKSSYQAYTYYINVLRTRGFFEFTWGAYVIKDKFVIGQGGFKIFDSDYVMGSGMNRVFLNGLGKVVSVNVYPYKINSIYDFIAGCAKI